MVEVVAAELEVVPDELVRGRAEDETSWKESPLTPGVEGPSAFASPLRIISAPFRDEESDPMAPIRLLPGGRWDPPSKSRTEESYQP